MAFDYEIIPEKAIAIIYLEGTITDKYEAAEFLADLDDHIADGICAFVIDLKKVEYLNSSGLSVLLNILTRARNASGEAIICNVSGKVRKLLIMTKLDAIFNFASNHKEARELLSKSGQSDFTHGT